MKKIIRSLQKKRWYAIVHLTFVYDAIDRLINNEFRESDIEILKNSFEQTYNSLIKLCEEQEALLFPHFMDFITNDEKLSMEREHIRIIEVLQNLKSKVERNGKIYHLDDLIDLKAGIHNLGLLLTLHHARENDILFIVAKNNLLEKELSQLFTIKQA